jgi:hypothetical protein
MNDTVKQIIGLLQEGRPELQVAAAQVLGHLRSQDAEVADALATAMSRSSVLGRFALEALAQIGSARALQVVVEQALGNEMLSDQAFHLLGEAGPAAHKAIAAATLQAEASRRVRLLEVLLKDPSKDVVGPLMAALADPDVGAEASRLFDEHQQALPDAVLKQLREALVEKLSEELPAAAMAAVLTVIGRLGQGAAKAILLKHAGEKFPTAVRNAALAGLVGEQLTALQAKGLLVWLEDAEHAPVHAALRDVLSAMPEWPAGLATQLKRIMASRVPEQRMFALKAMGAAATPEVVKLALKVRDHADPRYRSAAESVLGASKHAVEPLLRLLQASKDPTDGGRLAKLLVQSGPQMPLKLVKSIAEKAIKGIAAKQPSADLLLDVAMEVGGTKIVPLCLEKAIRWRRSKKFHEALHLLAKLATNDLLDKEGIYQLALARFLQDVHTTPTEDGAAPGNAAMGFFTTLLRQGFDLLERVRKDTSVPPELQLRLASYFANSVGAERRFGTELLQMLATRTKGKTADDARMALRAVH